eukprot:scaffold31618_cov40-Tisochrysis_lutea.AAC.2
MKRNKVKQSRWPFASRCTASDHEWISLSNSSRNASIATRWSSVNLGGSDSRSSNGSSGSRRHFSYASIERSCSAASRAEAGIGLHATAGMRWDAGE